MLRRHPSGVCGFGVGLYRALDSGSAIGQILRVHRWADCDSRVEGQEPWFCDGRELRGILHIEKHVSSAFTVFLAEIGGFWFEIIEDGFDCGTETRVASSSVPSLDGDGGPEHHAHLRALLGRGGVYPLVWVVAHRLETGV